MDSPKKSPEFTETPKHHLHEERYSVDHPQEHLRAGLWLANIWALQKVYRPCTLLGLLFDMEYGHEPQVRSMDQGSILRAHGLDCRKYLRALPGLASPY